MPPERASRRLRLEDFLSGYGEDQDKFAGRTVETLGNVIMLSAY